MKKIIVGVYKKNDFLFYLDHVEKKKKKSKATRNIN